MYSVGACAALGITHQDALSEDLEKSYTAIPNNIRRQAKMLYVWHPKNRKNDLILIMTPEKQDKTLELSKHWSADSTPARNEVIMKRTYPVNR